MSTATCSTRPAMSGVRCSSSATARAGHDWPALGANTVLAPEFDRGALLDALETHSERVGRGDEIALAPASTPNGWRAPLVAVVGSPGSGGVDRRHGR